MGRKIPKKDFFVFYEIEQTRNHNCFRMKICSQHFSQLLAKLLAKWELPKLQTWSQSYDFELQFQHCKILQRNYVHNSMDSFYSNKVYLSGANPTTFAFTPAL
jgi:hypothetical protein